MLQSEENENTNSNYLTEQIKSKEHNKVQRKLHALLAFSTTRKGKDKLSECINGLCFKMTSVRD